MFNLDGLVASFKDTPLERWGENLADDLEAVLAERTHGDENRWLEALNNLPNLDVDDIDMSDGIIHISSNQLLDEDERAALKQTLQQLMPWRKGPYEVHGVYIDTEWRSDWKWQRITPHLSDLSNRLVLDVGCGNGYHGWRIAEAGAKLVIGIDPSRLFLMQYLAIKHFLRPKHYPFFMLPFGIQHMPENLQAFDTVFSMGVLYHRKSPMDHLQELKNCLRPGGELVLETIVIEGDEGMTLVPKDRYAKMRNVWFIPSVPTLVLWLERTGFKNIRVVDVSETKLEEQRSTDWMRFESLRDYLDPDDLSKTVEGYPAPKRAVLIAKA